MKKNNISLILNIIIVLLVILSNILMFLKINFMKPVELLVVSGIENYKFYTADSNLLMGIISIIFIVYLLRLKHHKIDSIPNGVYILKMIGTSCITLTFVVTLCFLSPMYGFYAMYNNANLFFHLIIPLLSVITYIFFEKHDNKYKYAILGIIPMFIYGIIYATNILVHVNNDGLTFKYDFYGFLQGNINNIYFVIPIIFLVGYLISLLIIFLNKKLAK